ncbi:MAG: DUF2442 domain-containing protein [Planctomycetia bacterium]|nr:MAG: DUF2442 domain-containing protein [Planctomycetia bacterium]GJQ24930.1 MAG: hypothetical protein HBSAPP01_27200 [Candidatus Brocadia sapporoensis]HQU31565.1 DUF2442 domain-containing protein [Candidatus Brocadia sapporoensis]
MIPHVIDAEYIKDYIIKVRFDDGSLKMVNLESYTKRGGIFSKFSDKEFFKKFFIDLNTLCWPNGADIAPERLFEIGEEIFDELLTKD